MNLDTRDIEWPESMKSMARQTGSRLVTCCRVNGWLLCFVTVEAGLWHLSVSHPRRYPTWDEIKALRYALLPAEKTFAILLPPMDQYVNLHPNCFHLHEVPEMHEAATSDLQGILTFRKVEVKP